MKVLHFIPSLSVTVGSNIFGYKTELLETMSKYAEVHLLTADVLTQPIKGVSAHKYSPLKNVFGSRFSSFDKFILSIRPNIVHIHSCWNIQAYYFLKCCLRHRLHVVVTVDKQLEPWHIANNYLLGKVFKTLLFQYKIIRKASVIHAVNKIEKTTIYNWNSSIPFSNKSIENKIEIIEIFKKQSGYTSEKMSQKMLSLYRKIIDKRPFLSMSADDCRLEDLFIKAAISDTLTLNKFTEEDKKLLSSLTEESSRMILLHSHVQGVYDLLIKGAKKCDITLPQIKIEYCDVIDSKFLSSCSKSNLSEYDKNDGIMVDDLMSDVEKKIYCCISRLKNKFKGSLSTINRYDFVVLYNLLRHSNYDEVLLRDKMIKYDLDKFAARVFHILKERYGLSEGFMFIEPINDIKTKKMITKLYKNDIQ